MNSIATLIASEDAGYVTLARTSQSYLTSSVLLYLFREISCSELSRRFKVKLEWTGQQCIDFRRSLAGNGYLQCNLKFMVYAKMCGHPVTSIDYGVKEADKEWLNRIAISKNEDVKVLKKACAKTFAQGYKPRKPSDFRSPLTRAMNELRPYAGRCCGKKLRFLIISGQLKEDEIVSDLMEYSIKAMYKAYPRIDSFLHLVNIGKTAVHNRAMNIINENTTISRSRMQRQTDGSFAGMILSMSDMKVRGYDGTVSMVENPMMFQHGPSLRVCNGLVAGIDGSSSDLEYVTSVDSASELRHDVDSVLNKVKPNQRRVIDLLMGSYDEKFSAYLGKDNSVAMDHMKIEDYREHVRVFLKVSRENYDLFVSSLRRKFSAYRSNTQAV